MDDFSEGSSPGVGTTKLSSRGQVVIPEEIREQLGLRTGAKFVVIGSSDSIILKRISEPSPEEFEAMLAKTHKQAKEAGITPEMIEEEIRQYRKEKS
jgi:AbrB family looped-hinge helix DNA binding protein